MGWHSRWWGRGLYRVSGRLHKVDLTLDYDHTITVRKSRKACAGTQYTTDQQEAQ